MANGVENKASDTSITPAVGIEEVSPGDAAGLFDDSQNLETKAIDEPTGDAQVGIEEVNDPFVLEEMGAISEDALSKITDDIRNLRSRNMGASWEEQKPLQVSRELDSASLRMMENIANAWNAPGQMLNEGLSQMFGPDGSLTRSVAGLVNVANSAAGSLFAPVSSALAITRETPILGDVQSLFEKPIGFAAEVVESNFRLTGYSVAKQLGADEKHAKELGEALGRTGNMLTQIVLAKKAFEMVRGVPGNVKQTGRAIREGANRIMGTASKAGENLQEAKAIAQTAINRKITINEAGLTEGERIVKRLHSEVWDKIITPATDAGVGFSGRKLKAVIDEFEREANSVLIKDPKVKRAIKQIRKGLEETLSQLPDGDTFTPAQLQRYKEKLNAELSALYERKARKGSLRKPEETKLALKEKLNNTVRDMLETLHPELHGVNLEIGNILKLIPEIKKYNLERYTGTHSPKFKGTTGLTTFSGKLFIYTQLLGTRSFRSKLAIALDRVGRLLSGDPLKLAEISNPYTWHGAPPSGTSPFSAPPPPTAPVLPVSTATASQQPIPPAPQRPMPPAPQQPIVGGRATTPPPRGPDVVDAKFSDVPPEQLRHPVVERGNLLPFNKEDIAKKYKQIKSANEMILEIEAKLLEALEKQYSTAASIAKRTGISEDEVLEIASKYYDALRGAPSKVDGVRRTAKEILDQYPFAEEAARPIAEAHDLRERLTPEMGWIQVAQSMSTKYKISFEKALDVLGEARIKVSNGEYDNIHSAIEAIMSQTKSETK